MRVPDTVRVIEVGPRDGLQNEAVPVSLAEKVALVDRLAAAGLPVIEAGSFVSPRWVPQMADSEAVFAAIRRRPGTAYAALVPNLRGMERAVAAGVDEVVVFTAATESFSTRNTNCSIDDGFARFAPVAAMARTHGIPMRGALSCALGCPYEGAVAPAAVAGIAARLAELGCATVSLADTIGTGTPLQMQAVVDAVAAVVPRERLTVHVHDTYGQALANILAALERGVATIESSAGGLGGCPFAPGATGNVATEDVLYMLHGMGIRTGVDLDAVVEASWAIAGILGRPPASRVARALRARRSAEAGA